MLLNIHDFRLNFNDRESKVESLELRAAGQSSAAGGEPHDATRLFSTHESRKRSQLTLMLWLSPPQIAELPPGTLCRRLLNLPED